MGYCFLRSTLLFVKKSIATLEYKLLLSLLVDLRESQGIRQSELATRLKKPQSFISKYESGERRLDVVELRGVCLALGTSLQAFIERYENHLLEKEGSK